MSILSSSRYLFYEHWTNFIVHCRRSAVSTHNAHFSLPNAICKNRLRLVRGVNHHQRLALELFRAAFLDPTLGRVSKSKDDGCYIWFLKVAQVVKTEILCWKE